MRSRVRALSFAALSMLWLAGCSMFGGGSSQPVSGVYDEQQVTATATVQKIDLTQRLVTLKSDATGGNVVVKCGPEVKNLPQLKVGDVVAVTYYQSIAYEIHKPGTMTDTETQAAAGLATAEAGQKPGAVAAEIVRTTATIVSIDKSTPSVTLKGEDGQVVAVKVKHPEKLSQIKVGDVAEIFLSRAVAITVEPTSATK